MLDVFRFSFGAEPTGKRKYGSLAEESLREAEDHGDEERVRRREEGFVAACGRGLAAFVCVRVFGEGGRGERGEG